VSVFKLVYDGEATAARSHNEMPENIREISPSEFWHKMGTYTPKRIEFRQPIVRNADGAFGGFVGGLHMYWFSDDDGLAFMTEWDPDTRHYQGPNDFWARFFWFGKCRHSWREMTQREAKEKGQVHFGMCYHVCECSLCGKFMSYDSSD